jgi:hypothetical protein
MALIAGLRNALLPTKQATTNVTLRSDDYGTLFVLDGLVAPQTQAYEGSKFSARAIPAVAGTGVVLGSFTTAFSDTAKVALALTNNELAGGKTYVIDYIKARVIAAGSTTTSVEAAAEVDTTNRYSSGGTALVVYKTNPATTAPASLATCKVGDVTCAAASANRQHIGQQLVKKCAAPVIVVDETFIFTFGNVNQTVAAVTAGPVATTMIGGSYPFPSAAVPPGGSFLFKLAHIANATTPPQYDFEISWVER